jgi:hypothetical protein
VQAARYCIAQTAMAYVSVESDDVSKLYIISAITYCVLKRIEEGPEGLQFKCGV